jgi:cation diffusion facilitator CzcD-associated flavoprotein CzcO
LLSARGNLNDIAWPKIPGLETFKGEVMHSAAWNQKFVLRFKFWFSSDVCRYDFKNKRIGVIGGGSSSIQIVPSLQKVKGTQLTCFVRSRTWISNPFGDSKFLNNRTFKQILTRT